MKAVTEIINQKQIEENNQAFGFNYEQEVKKAMIKELIDKANPDDLDKIFNFKRKEKGGDNIELEMSMPIVR